MAYGPANVGEPMTLAVLPDTSVLHTSRDGTLRRTDHSSTTRVVGRIPVYSHDEEGLQGIGVDPGFVSNRVIYLYYAPPMSTPTDNAPAEGTQATWDKYRGVNRLSRFTVNADWSLNTGSERTVLEVPVDRGTCCHVGGDIDFDAAGNLYLTTGDDTSAGGDSGGYAPLDERTNRNPAYDAQRSAANTNDLRGKVLRFKVNPETGAYTIPAGNLYPEGTPNTKPQIYAMGLRNPFRMSVDKANGAVYLGDYGPDAAATDPNRGPSGQVEFNRITSAGNYGWPYCTGTNSSAETYNEWNFATVPQSTGPKFNCTGGPTNNSFRNTGVSTLKPARPSWLRYGGDAGSPPEFGTGQEAPMGGPVYRYNASNSSPVKFPRSYDGHFFAGEFGRKWIKDIAVNADGSPGKISSFPWTGTQVMDMQFGPDGALYVLDYGTGGWFTANPNVALYRIEYIGGGNRAPIAKANADKTSGYAPLTGNFSSAGSSDPEGTALSYRWDFGDGGTSTAANPSHTYNSNGQYTVRLTVTDGAGTATTVTTPAPISVGNKAPTVKIEVPLDGGLFEWGDRVHYRVTATDAEDGTIDCSRVQVTYGLGHNDHGHGESTVTGCTGSVVTEVDAGHDGENVYGSFLAKYTDKGANGIPPITSETTAVIQPRHRQAEHYSASSGVTLYTKSAAEATRTVGDINNGDWIAFGRYALDGAKKLTARVSSGGVGGTLQVRTGSPTGTVLGSVAVPVTGGWETFRTVTADLTNVPTGSTTLYLTFAGGSGALFDVDSFTVDGGRGPITGIAGKCVDVNGGATADGTKVQLLTCAPGAEKQIWNRIGKTYQSMGKCLDVQGAGTTDYTTVHFWSCNDTPAQDWVSDQQGRLVNPNSNKCLDPLGGKSDDGTQLIIYTCHTGTNQKWTAS